jgi:hypothetical protein
VRQLREQLVTLGLVLKVPLGRVEDISTQLENLFGGRLIFRRFSAGKLWIVDRDPLEGSR